MVSLSVICCCRSSCNAVLHSYITVVQQNIGQKDGRISTYFNLGFSHAEILSFLTLSHGIHIRLRQLKSRSLPLPGIPRALPFFSLSTGLRPRNLCGQSSTKEASAEERVRMCAEKHQSRYLLFPDWLHSLVSSNQHGVLTA